MKKRSQLAFIISAIIATNASAGLEIYSSSVDAGNKTADYSFNQSGVSGENADKVQGHGKDMPLGLALQIIIPKSWHVNLNAGSEELLVDWEGKTSWPYVLENLAKNNNLNIKLDWTSKVVDIYSSQASKSKQLAMYEEDLDKERIGVLRKNSKYKDHMEKEVEDKLGESSSIEEIYSRSNVKPVDGKIRTFVSNVYNNTITEETQAKFILKSGVMLSENLKMWGEYTGWDVKWNSNVDYKITNEVVFEGNLKRSIENSLKLYSEGEKPLKASFYDGNKVVDIRDFIFKDPKLKIEQ
jgi:hypothetical protein